MASRLSSRVVSRLVHNLLVATPTAANHHFTTVSTAIPISRLSTSIPDLYSQPSISSHPCFSYLSLRSLSTLSSPRPSRPRRSARPDIGTRARQLQTRRLWTYALAFSCVAGFIIIVLNQFQDQLVFYVTPSEALEKFTANPSKAKFRLGGLVLEGSVKQIPSSPFMEFVITDLLTDILVRYEGSLPDLFREGHSVVVEGFIKPFTEEMREKDEVLLRKNEMGVSQKARAGDCFFAATEVLAKHDEKYMPKEVAVALEKNKKLLEQQQEDERSGAAVTA